MRPELSQKAEGETVLYLIPVANTVFPLFSICQKTLFFTDQKKHSLFLLFSNSPVSPEPASSHWILRHQYTGNSVGLAKSCALLPQYHVTYDVSFGMSSWRRESPPNRDIPFWWAIALSFCIMCWATLFPNPSALLLCHRVISLFCNLSSAYLTSSAGFQIPWKQIT